MELLEWDVPSTRRKGQILSENRGLAEYATPTSMRPTTDWPVKPTLPFIPGHEAIGLVTAVGSGVIMVKEGDPGRGALAVLKRVGHHCGILLDRLGNGLRSGRSSVWLPSRNGSTTLNTSSTNPELCCSYSYRPSRLRMPAPLICRWNHHDLQGDQGDQPEARPGEWIAISGAGGLGHLAHSTMLGRQRDYLSAQSSIDDGKLAHATRLGADFVINAKAGDPAAAVLKKATARRNSWRSDYRAFAHCICNGTLA